MAKLRDREDEDEEEEEREREEEQRKEVRVRQRGCGDSKDAEAEAVCLWAAATFECVLKLQHELKSVEGALLVVFVDVYNCSGVDTALYTAAVVAAAAAGCVLQRRIRRAQCNIVMTSICALLRVRVREDFY